MAILDELDKRGHTNHALQLPRPTTLESNFLQRPREQLIEDETGRLRRANALNVSLISDIQPVTRKGNVCVSVRVGEVLYALKDRLLVCVSRRSADRTLIFRISQDHAFVNAQESSEALGPTYPQWFVNLVGMSRYARRQALPFWVRLALCWPEAPFLSIGTTVDILIVEKARKCRVGAPFWVFLKAVGEC